MREEEDIAWQLGIGCGGLVRILLQAVNANNDYLQLVQLREYINQNQACKYIQYLNEGFPNNKLELMLKGEEGTLPANHHLSPQEQNDNKEYFEHIIKPSLKLAIFGGGIDAIPVATIAAKLGWHVTIADPRTGYARQSQFVEAKQIVKTPLSDTNEHTWLLNIDAIVIMTHNLKLDAQALNLAQNSTATYVGMLGPTHRTDRVLKEAGLTRTELNLQTQAHSSSVTKVLTKPLANPIGLRLGGELPESIALSMLAEIHAFMEQCDGKSISNILN
jgi:xanthine/CO dehydrogenase XdhC/CoxF family maturation factor